ncbi:MAG TPA: FliH/SctL family protein [Acidobacteriaceae bacterium]|jgi:flagellar assembly protein FliH
MDAEIRRLTYVPRFNGKKAGSGLPGFGPLIGELPSLLHKDERAKHSVKATDVRLEARLIELERERTESERHHHEALAAAHQKAAEELAIALHEQKERLEREYAGSIQAAVSAFQEAQARYFTDAEAGVVRLALSIAARVLHREAQLDPLLLRGAVRVALEDAQQSATCVLETAAERAEAWERWLSDAGLLARVQIRVMEDADPGHCRLEIGASAADLNVNTQLAEIERGFFDLLQSRPTAVDYEAKQER